MDSENSDSKSSDSESSDSEETQSNVISSTIVSSTSRYSGGRIMRIKLVNFMVYDNVEIFPGPGLNLIIGPNGSGKSTTVCGICLGLAGKATFTGRKMRIADYVKHGKQQATIEIELDDPSKKNNTVFRRVINASGTSQYWIDSHLAKENIVEKEVSRFNIQMNNLCQFLPQERVSEFCKMNAIQLLESMQQAVGDVELFKSHNELKNLRNGCRELETEIVNKETNLSSEKKKNERIETEAQIYADIQKLNKRKTLLNEQIPILRYKETHEIMMLQKKKKQQLFAKEKNFQRGLDPIRNELEVIKNNISQHNQQLKEKTNFYSSKKKNVGHLANQITAIENKIGAAYADLELKIQEQSRSQERIKAIETQLIDHRNDHDRSEETLLELELTQSSISHGIEGIIKKIHSADVELDDLQKSINHSTYKKQGLERELQKLSGIEHKKLEVLKRLDLDTFNAVIWLRDNRRKFKKQVYDPILMMIDVPSPNDIKYIENHISFRDLIAFVCEDKEDSQILVEKLRKEKGWAINTVLAPQRRLSDFQPRITNNELKRYYFLSCYVKDIFKAPDPIVSFLCATYNIHNTPIGGAPAENHINDITNSNKFSRFYTTDSMYTVKRSRYGAQNVSVVNSILRPAHILNSFTNTSDQQKEIEEKITEIDAQLKVYHQKAQKCQAICQELNEELEALRRQKKTFADKKTALKSLEVLISQKEKSLQNLKKSCSDVAELRQVTEDLVLCKKNEKISLLRELEQTLKKCYEMKQTIIKIQFYVFAFSKKQILKAEKLNEEEESHKTLEMQCHEADQEYKRLKQLAIQHLREASNACGMPINDANLPALEAKYGNLPPTIEEVQSAIHKINAQIGCFGESDKSVYDEHQRRKGEIIKGEKGLKNAKARLADMTDEIQLKKEAWLTPLNALIEKISQTFSRYFQSLGCAGELGLKISENPDDFDKYGLSVRVKFRDNSPLQELSHAHHSGGECSVSTIIFILALQKLTEVPFRCVDEINQGMDSVNERRIFELVAMSSGTSSQYFLLTPKLLPGLTYPKEMKVHIIKNAPAIHEDVDWKISTIIANLRSQRKS